MKKLIKKLLSDWMWCKYWKLLKHKGIEIQIGRFEHGAFFHYNLSWTRKQDHAGIEERLEIFGFHIIFNLYDGRHWNYNKDRWYGPGEDSWEDAVSPEEYYSKEE